MTTNMWMTGHRVELPEMLAGRERRACHQAKLREQFPGTLVCFTLNIAGPHKVFALSEEVFRRTMESIRKALTHAQLPVVHVETDERSYGWEGYLAVNGDADAVKRALIALEEDSEAGRLFDIDVLNPDGSKVSREEFGMPPRSCLICGQPTIGCARSRAHTVEELQNKTAEIFLEELKRYPFTAERIAALCRQSMLMEVYTTPKPGLVDRRNNGSHKDMDVELFERSTYSLEGYFARCAAAGIERAETGDLADGLLAVIRPYGIEAERTMFEATGGVNTHKGMIFSLGIMACAAGYCLTKTDAYGRDDLSIISEILDTSGKIAMPAWSGDMLKLDGKTDRTNGEDQYCRYGIGGIRREAAEGFPSVRDLSYPIMVRCMDHGDLWQKAGCEALIHLIGNVIDTNMVARVGVEKAELLRRSALQLAVSEAVTREDLEEMDETFIGCNASPGGCADLLALTYFLFSVRAFLPLKKSI